MDITDTEIRMLRNEALHFGDWRLVDICDVALATFETADAVGAPLVDSDGQPMTRSEARTQCAEALAMVRAARA